MRRFELIKGNKATFWEIELDGDLVTTGSGQIGKAPRVKEERFDDEMEAEVNYDRLIHMRRNRGYVEVEEASVPMGSIAQVDIDLVPMDGSKSQHMPKDAMEYLLRRFVEVMLMDRQRQPPTLERWNYRATRKLRLTEPPEPGHPKYDDWMNMFLSLSAADRAEPLLSDMIGTYKYTQGYQWIVTAKECDLLS
ncbi:MAG: putative DNA-binding WGR domain protein, partial [Kiritimatiellia bacterium]